MSNINIWIRPKLDKKDNISRDAEILRYANAGLSQTEIAKMFDLSRTRVMQIISEQKRMSRRRANFERNELLSNRTVKALVYEGIVNTEQILALNEQDISKLRGIGTMTMYEIQNYQRIIKTVRKLIEENPDIIKKGGDK